MINDVYKVRGKVWKLERYPQYGSTALRAWSAADEYLVESIQLKTRSKPVRMLVLNDPYGAVTIPFTDQKVTVLVDSFLSEVAIRRNLKLNRLPENSVQFLSSTDEIQHKFDVLAIGMPQPLSTLEFQLQRIRAYLQPKCVIFAVAMAKDASSELSNILQQTLGPTVGPTAPIRNKARLFQLELDADTRRVVKEVPLRSYKIALNSKNGEADASGGDVEVLSAPGVFSSDRLDEGSRLLLEHLPETDNEMDVADYGCGSGVLGLVTIAQNPKASLLMIDDSRLALYSARESFKKNSISLNNHRFRLANGFVGTKPESLDLVISHPDLLQEEGLFAPWLALQFIQQSHTVLRTGGELLFVTTKECPILPMVEQIFGNQKILEEEGGYQVISATKQ